MDRKELALLFARCLLIKHYNGKNSLYTPDTYKEDEITAHEAIQEINKMLIEMGEKELIGGGE